MSIVGSHGSLWAVPHTSGWEGPPSRSPGPSCTYSHPIWQEACNYIRVVLTAA